MRNFKRIDENNIIVDDVKYTAFEDQTCNGCVFRNRQNSDLCEVIGSCRNNEGKKVSWKYDKSEKIKRTSIDIKDGCEFVEAHEENGKIVVTIREKKQIEKLAETWDEFCENYLTTGYEAYMIEDTADINTIKFKNIHMEPSHLRGVLPNQEIAKAVRALTQLIMLREHYNGTWSPDWESEEYKYCIGFQNNKIHLEIAVYFMTTPLFFKTEELRDKFLKNFQPLIEQLLPLYGGHTIKNK